METKEISYTCGNTTLTGYLADGARADSAPGILVCHQGGGLREHEKARAERLADLGYVAFAIDMYGKPVTKMEEAAPLMYELMHNPTLWQARVMAGVDTLKAQPNVDISRLAAIGFCFGGRTVIDMARYANEMACIVAFHPGMAELPASDDRPVVTRVLVCAGQKDPLIPPEAREQFLKLMADAGADAQLITYSQAGHSFTDEGVAAFNMPNFEYHAETDRRSWAAMRAMFDEALGPI